MSQALDSTIYLKEFKYSKGKCLFCLLEMESINWNVFKIKQAVVGRHIMSHFILPFLMCLSQKWPVGLYCSECLLKCPD
jgi:hypothetical protein